MIEKYSFDIFYNQTLNGNDVHLHILSKGVHAMMVLLHSYYKHPINSEDNDGIA